MSNIKKYSEEVVMRAAKESKLDLAMFEHDRRSKLAVESFREDQRLAAEMNVNTPPSMVVYNLDYLECAVSVENCTSLSSLEELIFGNAAKGVYLYQNELHPTYHQLSLKNKLARPLVVEQVYFFIVYLANSSFNSAKRSLKDPKSFL